MAENRDDNGDWVDDDARFAAIVRRVSDGYQASLWDEDRPLRPRSLWERPIVNIDTRGRL